MIDYESIASEKNYVTSSVILFDWPCIHSRPRVDLDYLKRGRSSLCSKLPAMCSVSEYVAALN